MVCHGVHRRQRPVALRQQCHVLARRGGLACGAVCGRPDGPWPEKAQGQRHQRHPPTARVHAVRPGQERELPPTHPQAANAGTGGPAAGSTYTTPDGATVRNTPLARPPPLSFLRHAVNAHRICMTPFRLFLLHTHTHTHTVPTSFFLNTAVNLSYVSNNH
jgi:hypothetical protein